MEAGYDRHDSPIHSRRRAGRPRRESDDGDAGSRSRRCRVAWRIGRGSSSALAGRARRLRVARPRHSIRPGDRRAGERRDGRTAIAGTIAVAIVGRRTVPVRCLFRALRTVRDSNAGGAPMALQTSPHARTTVTASQLAAAVWLLGCLIVLGRCVLGHVALARLARRQGAAVPASWIDALDAAAVDMDLRRGVQLVINARITAPVTAGWRRPVILLPSDAERWSGERRRVVLVHELAHVARADYLAQLVATFACALYWFHPLVWMAAARLRAEAEQSADDRVLAAGTTGVAYASHLLEIARAASAPRLAAGIAVGMVRSSRLESRFRAMLDAKRSRAPLPRRIRGIAASAALAAMVPLAGLRAVSIAAPNPCTCCRALAESAELQRTLFRSHPRPRRRRSLRPPSPRQPPRWRRPPIRSSTRALMPPTMGGFSSISSPAAMWCSTDGVSGACGCSRGSGAGIGAMPSYRCSRPAAKRSSARDSRLTARARAPWNSSCGSRTTPTWLLSSAGGSIVIDSVAGQFTGHTGGGSITIEHATGRASLSTGGGRIEIANSHLDGSVSTGSGGVSIRNVTGNIQGTSSGQSATSYSYGSSGGPMEHITSIPRPPPAARKPIPSTCRQARHRPRQALVVEQAAAARRPS